MCPGDRLPTIRSLAAELKTNPNTIAKAYGELEIRGVVATQVGSVTYISDKKQVMENAVYGAGSLNRRRAKEKINDGSKSGGCGKRLRP